VAVDEAMRGIEGERVLLRIILSESRMRDRQPLHRRLLDLLRADGFAGTTVLKGMAGFGHDREIHTVDLEVASEGLPIVLEVVDTEDRVEAFLPKLDALMSAGIVMVERARVIRYGATPEPDITA
jgi:PII-like signaling protein